MIILNGRRYVINMSADSLLKLGRMAEAQHIYWEQDHLVVVL
jgi:hypothetical protein